MGIEKGASPAPSGARIGKFEQCSGGTLVLDEIGDMPLASQAKVLRLLQEQVFERVGGNETVRTDVRLIAATHRDLESWSAEGKFRPDLYLPGCRAIPTIHLPPLHERGDDLPMLVHHYVRRFNREALNRDVREVTPETMERLCSYSWPGSIRELQSVLKQALLRATGRSSSRHSCPSRWADPAPRQRRPRGNEGGIAGRTLSPRAMEAGSKVIYQEAHQSLDRLLLPLVLRGRPRRSKLQAARLLGITRKTLRLKRRPLALGVSDLMSAEEDEDDAPRDQPQPGPGVIPL